MNDTTDKTLAERMEYAAELKGVGTGNVLCSCEDCVRNAVRSASEALD